MIYVSVYDEYSKHLLRQDVENCYTLQMFWSNNIKLYLTNNYNFLFKFTYLICNHFFN